MVELTSLCAGVGNMVWCRQVRGKEMDKTKVRLPERYRGFEVEKVVFSFDDMKLYAQIRYQNLVEVIEL